MAGDSMFDSDSDSDSHSDTDSGAGTVGRSAGRRASRAPRPGRRSVAVGVLVCVVLATLGALAGLWWADQRSEQVHTASSTVLLRPLEGNAFNPSTSGGTDLVNMETEAQLVGSSVVTGLAADRLGVPDQADEIRSGLQSTVPPNTQLVEVVTQGSDDQEAVDRAQVLAETFLAYRGDRAESDVFDRSARLREEIRAREEQRRELVKKLGGAKAGSPRAIVLEQRISELTTQLGEFRVQLAELDAASTDPGQVVTVASASPPGLLSQPWLLAALGAVLGLVLALLLVGGRRRLDRRVHGPADLSRAGVPVLGRLPLGAEERSRAVGGVRAAILAQEPSRPLVLGVATGAPSGEASALAATADLAGELGLSLRRSELVVAVLDLVSRPGRAPGPEGTAGPDLDSPLLVLSAVLGADHGVPDMLARRRASGLPLAVVNDLEEEELADLACSAEMVSLLDALRQVADVVVVDLGSLEDPSSQSLVGALDAIVLTVLEGSSTFAELEASLERLPTWGGRLSGLVCVAGARGRGGSSGRSRASGSARDDEPVASAADAMRSRPGDGASASSVAALPPRGPR